MFDALAGALAFFYDVWPSYGGAIFLFTIAIMVALSPLSIKSTRSMIRMQRVQPELKKLQTMYKDDRETLNREMMAFYQANNINPFSSCLPLLLQMPVFFVLFQVLQGLTKKDDTGHFDPRYLSEDSALASALRASTKMMSFGMDLSKSALTELKDEGLVTALPFFVLVVLVAGTQWYQQRQISGRRGAVAINPQQQMMTKILPFIIVPFALSFPAGLVVYYVTSNLVRVGQQALVTQLENRSSAPDIVIPPPSAPPAGSAKNPSGRPTPPTRPTGRTTQPGAPQRRKKRK
ncbi:MAG: YidC/Oxa1 family membrane protein insertase [Acidimicrobiia bacterium]